MEGWVGDRGKEKGGEGGREEKREKKKKRERKHQPIVLLSLQPLVDSYICPQP